MAGSVYGTQNTVDFAMIQGVLTDLQFQAGYRNVIATNSPATANFDLNSGIPTFTVQTPSGMKSFIAGANWNLIPNLVGDKSTDNSAAMAAYVGVGGYIDVNGLTGASVQASGVYRMGFVAMHPRADLFMNGRGAVAFQAVPNMPATNPSGAINSMFCVERVPPTVNLGGAYLAYVTVYEGFTIDGSTAQTNPIVGIRMPDPNPADNPYDPDPTYTTNKDYTAVKLHNVEIQHTSGVGYLAEKGNGRAHIFDSRVLNAGGNGFEFHTNDIVIGERTGAGGNNGFSIWNGQGSGLLMTCVNLWGYEAARSINTGALYTQGTLLAMSNCELNDWIFLDGTHGNSNVRAGVITNNCFAPHNEIFVSDGVAQDTGNTGDQRLQAQVVIAGYQGMVCGPNLFTRSTATSFATPYNTGGALDGSAGTAFPYLYYITGGAEVGIILQVSSAPNVKPWVNTNPALPSFNDPVPIATSGGNATYYFQDSHTGLHRFGTRGPGSLLHFMATDNENNAPNLTYQIELGGFNRKNLLYGSTELQRAIQYTSTAYHSDVISNGALVTLIAGQVYELLSVSGAGIAGATVALPMGQNASYELLICFGGGSITNLTWTGTFDTQTLPPPSTIGGQSSQVTTIRILYRADVDRWRIVAINSEANPFINMPSSGVLTLDLSSITNAQFVMSGAIALTTPGSPADGGIYTFCFIQDGIGGHSLTWSGGKWKAPGGTIPAVALAANAVTTYTFQYNLFLNVYLLIYSGVAYA